MSSINEKDFPYSWEEAISVLRMDPDHQELIYNSYLTEDIINNCERFAASDEFSEVLSIINHNFPDANKILDIPGGNGIATYAFASAGFKVTTVEPDPSDSVGRGAIEAVLDLKKLQANVVKAYGEKLPFSDSVFDIIYVRQGLHHAGDLNKMLQEYHRVLRSDGLLVACREHVVDNYGKSLQDFLGNQVDHQLYGGEHAFTLKDYCHAMKNSGFNILDKLEPYDSPINLYPNTLDSLKKKIRLSRAGKLLGIVFPRLTVEKIGLWQLKRSKLPGRLYSFIARKET